MASYQRGSLSIITSAEELPSGRYRGFVALTDGENECWRHSCKQCRDNPLDAHSDADADMEYAYRHYLSEHIGGNGHAGTSAH